MYNTVTITTASYIRSYVYKRNYTYIALYVYSLSLFIVSSINYVRIQTSTNSLLLLLVTSLTNTTTTSLSSQLTLRTLKLFATAATVT